MHVWFGVYRFWSWGFGVLPFLVSVSIVKEWGLRGMWPRIWSSRFKAWACGSSGIIWSVFSVSLERQRLTLQASKYSLSSSLAFLQGNLSAMQATGSWAKQTEGNSKAGGQFPGRNGGKRHDLIFDSKDPENGALGPEYR